MKHGVLTSKLLITEPAVKWWITAKLRNEANKSFVLNVKHWNGRENSPRGLVVRSEVRARFKD